MSRNSSFMKFLSKLWVAWNIRFVVLTSLFLQVVLIFLAPLRKHTKKSILIAFLWCAYLLADYVATFGIGLLSKKYSTGGMGRQSKKMNEFFINTFWAPFLLLHLGGPDTITAYSLEDNQLWLRHLLHLIFQVYYTIYVFVSSLPENPLWIPTSLILVAGIIKYVERNRSLQLASARKFEDDTISRKPPGISVVKLMKKASEGEKTRANPKEIPLPLPGEGVTRIAEPRPLYVEVLEAYELFNKFKGMVVNMIFSLRERNESHDYFTFLNWEKALRVIEIELNLFYDAFYTKAQISCTKLGLFFRFVSLSCTLTALLLFIIFLRGNNNHNFKHMDVTATYALLYGALSLEVASFFMLLVSDHSVVFFAARNNRSSFANNILELRENILPRRLWHGRLSETISGFNLILYCFRRREIWADKVIQYAGATELVRQWKYEDVKQLRKPDHEKLWDFIFQELKRKSSEASDVDTIQKICTSKGAWVIRHCHEISPTDKHTFMYWVDIIKFTFDESIILWHIATDFLYCEEDDESSSNNDFKLISKVLSDYMMYLLIMQPSMMSTVRGIAQITFEATCEEATYLLQEISKKHKLHYHPFTGIKKLLKKINNNDRGGEEPGRKRVLEKKQAAAELNTVCAELLEFLRANFTECTELIGSNRQLIMTEGEFRMQEKKISKSVLLDARRLAEDIKRTEIERSKKWEMVAKVWVELLSYAASNCIPIAHVHQLKSGGEFLSLVCLLMTHLGLSKQFQIQ